MPEPTDKAERIRQHYSTVFSSEPGQIVLRDLMRTGHVFDSTAEMGICDPNAMMFREGGRNIVLYILSMIKRGDMSGSEFQHEADRQLRESVDDPVERIMAS